MTRVANWSHYNQPLAHPFGANFFELIGILHYQPAYRWNIELKCIYNKQGLDSAGENFGSNVLLNYDTRPREYGFYICSGIPATVVNARPIFPIRRWKIYFWKEPSCIAHTR